MVAEAAWGERKTNNRSNQRRRVKGQEKPGIGKERRTWSKNQLRVQKKKKTATYRGPLWFGTSQNIQQEQFTTKQQKKKNMTLGLHKLGRFKKD